MGQKRKGNVVGSKVVKVVADPVGTGPRITMAHGAGGSIMGSFIKATVLENLKACAIQGKRPEVPLEALDDAGVMDGIVLTTDSYVVKPLFFPGGDIGHLAVSGTINDISVMGAEPVALSTALIIEEGMPLDDIARVVQGMGRASKQAGVPIITGDTKVVERGALDQMFVNTAGIGRDWDVLRKDIEIVRAHRPHEGRWLTDASVRPGDAIIVSGTLGDHGIALLSFREGYGFESTLQSDARPMNDLVAAALKVGGVAAMKDPTRGGLANTLNEWSEKSGVGIEIDEDTVPLKEAVTSACEMLGMDPLTIGNEGKVVFSVVPEQAEDILKAIRRNEAGKDAAIIGKALPRTELKGVVLRTVVGGRRIVDPPAGDPVPRIC